MRRVVFPHPRVGLLWSREGPGPTCRQLRPPWNIKEREKVYQQIPQNVSTVFICTYVLRVQFEAYQPARPEVGLYLLPPYTGACRSLAKFKRNDTLEGWLARASAYRMRGDSVNVVPGTGV